MNPNVLIWLMGRDTGASSRVIVAWMELNPAVLFPATSGRNHPLDADDLGRCIRLLDIEPSYRERIGEMAQVSAAWAVLVAHWAELESLYREEVPTGRGYGPKCSARMYELLGRLDQATKTTATSSQAQSEPQS